MGFSIDDWNPLIHIQDRPFLQSSQILGRCMLCTMGKIGVMAFAEESIRRNSPGEAEAQVVMPVTRIVDIAVG